MIFKSDIRVLRLFCIRIDINHLKYDGIHANCSIASENLKYDQYFKENNENLENEENCK